MVSPNMKKGLVWVGFVLSSALIVVTADAQPVSFIGRRDFEVGRSPQSIAIGDFNGDGVPDMAVANFGDSEFPGDVSVLLGSADGTLEAARSFRAGRRPRSIAVGDFNGDGIQDLAVADGESNDVSVLLGNGDGSFQTAMNFAIGSFQVFVAVGDFNGDGVQDLAVAKIGSDEFPGSVSVLLGNGDGTFQMARDFDAGIGPVSIAVADFNGDGVQDLAVANAGGYVVPPGSVSVLLGNGDGTFQMARDFDAGTHPRAIVVGHFNRDGALDLAVANAGSNDVSVLLGNRRWKLPKCVEFRGRHHSGVSFNRGL